MFWYTGFVGTDIFSYEKLYQKSDKTAGNLCSFILSDFDPSFGVFIEVFKPQIYSTFSELPYRLSLQRKFSAAVLRKSWDTTRKIL